MDDFMAIDRWNKLPILSFPLNLCGQPESRMTSSSEQKTFRSSPALLAPVSLYVSNLIGQHTPFSAGAETDVQCIRGPRSRRRAATHGSILWYGSEKSFMSARWLYLKHLVDVCDCSATTNLLNNNLCFVLSPHRGATFPLSAPPEQKQIEQFVTTEIEANCRTRKTPTSLM